MHIQLPHFNPRQRALLRGLLGAIVAVLLAVTMLVLMAVLLVFPQRVAGMSVPSAAPAASAAPAPPLSKQLPKLRA